MSQLYVDNIKNRTGGAIGAPSGVVVTGIVTATQFSGNVTGVAATFSGNVSVGGVLTYEDVTNIDSVGVITARSGIEFGASGVGGTITASGQAEFIGIVTALGVNVPDNSKFTAGAGDDLQIYHDGNHSRIVDSGTGHLVLASSQIHALNAGQNEVMFNAIENAQVGLYYDGTKKFETTTAGATVTGTISDSKGELRKLIPNTQAGAYTLVASDAGKYIWASGAVTVPNNIFSAGDMVTIVNDTNGNLTITNSLSVMYMSSDGTNAASRTLGAYGMATLLFVSGTAAYISGAGLS